MKKDSTPATNSLTAVTVRSRRASTPHAATVAFLRQFARVYTPAPRPALPGIILN